MVMKGKTVIEFYRFYESTTGKIPVPLIGEIWFLENVIELDKRKFEQIKRFVDIILAVLFFIPFALIAPFAALAIKLTSRGNIFYKQKRLGKNGKIFEIIKFRSMAERRRKRRGEVGGKRRQARNRRGKVFKKNETGRIAPDIKRSQRRLIFCRSASRKAGIRGRIVAKNTLLSNEAYRQTGTFRLGPNKFPLRLFR